MEKKRLQIGLLYLSFHNSLKKIYGLNRFVSERDMEIKLGRQFLVPKPLRIIAIKELVNMKLLKKVDDKLYKILDYKLNVEKDTQKFLRRINFI